MQCLLPGIFSCCLLFLHIVSGVVRLEDERSSFVSLKHDTCLRGHIIQTKKASSLMICAQYCLTNGKCKSVNFRKKGICELNDASPEESHVHDDVKCQGEVTLGWLVRYTTQAYVFTSLNGQGMNGPTSTDGYRRTSLQGTVTITNGSIQYWVTPEPGNYVIEAVGASGANGTCSNSGCSGWSLGGKGAKIKGSFALKKGNSTENPCWPARSGKNGYTRRPRGRWWRNICFFGWQYPSDCCWWRGRWWDHFIWTATRRRSGSDVH